MAHQVAVIWEGPVLFTRLFEECGHTCELVTPHLLAAPFFKRRFHGVVIPAGFAAPGHTSILAALRAISPRIKRFVSEGGTVLAFGAGTDMSHAYDWLPVPITYRYGFAKTQLAVNEGHTSASILEDGADEVSIDGILDNITGISDGQVILEAPSGPVMVQITYGSGRIIIASLHEYPSHRFVREFCAGGGEGLL